MVIQDPREDNQKNQHNDFTKLSNNSTGRKGHGQAHGQLIKSRQMTLRNESLVRRAKL